MGKKKSGELVVVEFDYSALEAKVAEKVRSAAERIGEKLQRTVKDIIEIGNDLLAVKDEFPHGQFGKWLQYEFGWGARMAQHFMNVAERFGPKSEMISHLQIPPTSAYLLAARSVPDDALEAAIKRAEGGEKITTAVAKSIVAETKKKKGPRKPKEVSTKKLGERLADVLHRYQDWWNPNDMAELARQLREFADEVEKPARAGRKRRRG